MPSRFRVGLDFCPSSSFRLLALRGCAVSAGPPGWGRAVPGLTVVSRAGVYVECPRSLHNAALRVANQTPFDHGVLGLTVATPTTAFLALPGFWEHVTSSRAAGGEPPASLDQVHGPSPATFLRVEAVLFWEAPGSLARCMLAAAGWHRQQQPAPQPVEPSPGSRGRDGLT